MNVGSAVVFGTGLVGSAVAQRLATSGWSITAVGRPADRSLARRDLCSGIEVVEARLDMDGIRTLLAARRPSTVIAATGRLVGGVDEIESLLDSNVRSVGVILSAAAAVNVQRAVVFGSGFEYPPSSTPIAEDRAPGPTTVYGATKVAATELALHLGGVLGLEVCVVRPFSLYGPRERVTRFVPSVVTASLLGMPVRMSVGDQIRDYLYVEDLADGIELALTSQSMPRLVNFSGREQMTLLELARLILQVAGSRSQLMLGSRKPNPSDRHVFLGDSSSAGRLLGWRPEHDLMKGLAKTVDWYRANREVWESDVR